MSGTETDNIKKARDIAANTIADHAKGEDSGPAGMDWLDACPEGERRELRVGEIMYAVDRRLAPFTPAPHQPPGVRPVEMPAGPGPAPAPNGGVTVTY